MNVLNKLHDARSPMLRGVTGAFLATLTVAGGFAVANHKTVTLTIDGAPMTVQTMKTRIGDVLTENGFSVGERDDLFPAADHDVHESDNIVLRRSRPLEISLDGQNTRQVWTTAATVQDALKQLSMTDTATLEQDDAPSGATDTPSAATANLVNLWQSESVGFKVVRRINFQKRRSGAVVYLDNAEYGGVVS